MGGVVEAIAPVLGPVGTALSIVSSVKGMSDARKSEKRAKQVAEANVQEANALAVREEAERNKRAARKPNTSAMATANTAGAKQATLLTSPSGIDPRSLTLGRNRVMGA